LPQDTPPIDWLVVPIANAYAAAFAYAQTIRDATPSIRVEVELSGETRADAVRATARDRSIRQIAWISADAEPELESLTDWKRALLNLDMNLFERGTERPFQKDL